MRLIGLILIVLSLTPFTHADTITVAADPWCPYNCDPNHERQGSMIDVAREALGLFGHTLEYTTINWARTKKLVQSGDIDAIVGMSKSPDNQDLYVFPEQALGISQICFFKRSSASWQYTGPDSLQQIKTVGWINDYGVSKKDPLDQWIKSNIDSNKVNIFAGNNLHKRLFEALGLRRIDTFPEDRNVIKFELQKQNKHQAIDIAGCSNNFDPVYLAFSPRVDASKQWAKHLVQGVETLTQNGRLAAILKPYGLTVENWLSH